jgi:pyruvate/2-oxoglutarate/acetoin dehydrogenase E1 component
MPTVLDSLNTSLHQALTDNPAVILLGEDILDPYGGAFKVTRGLSSDFPDRVVATPISEARDHVWRFRDPYRGPGDQPCNEVPLDV